MTCFVKGRTWNDSQMVLLQVIWIIIKYFFYNQEIKKYFIELYLWANIIIKKHSWLRTRNTHLAPHLYQTMKISIWQCKPTNGLYEWWTMSSAVILQVYIHCRLGGGGGDPVHGGQARSLLGLLLFPHLRRRPRGHPGVHPWCECLRLLPSQKFVWCWLSSVRVCVLQKMNR